MEIGVRDIENGRGPFGPTFEGKLEYLHWILKRKKEKNQTNLVFCVGKGTILNKRKKISGDLTKAN